MGHRGFAVETLAASKRRVSLGLRAHTALRNVRMGRGTYVMSGSTFRQHVTVGDHSFIGRRCSTYVVPVELGNFVLIASDVLLVGGDHRFDIPGVPTTMTGRGEVDTVRIGDDVRIGTRTIVLAGSQISEGAVTGAGAVVTGDVPAYCIAVGVPARPIRARFDGKFAEHSHRAMLEEYRHRDDTPA